VTGAKKEHGATRYDGTAFLDLCYCDFTVHQQSDTTSYSSALLFTVPYFTIQITEEVTQDSHPFSTLRFSSVK